MTTLLWTSDDSKAVLGYFLSGTFGTRFGLFTPASSLRCPTRWPTRPSRRGDYG
jgi:hypothetical protein